jgi:hypothetical protein
MAQLHERSGWPGHNQKKLQKQQLRTSTGTVRLLFNNIWLVAKLQLAEQLRLLLQSMQRQQAGHQTPINAIQVSGVSDARVYEACAHPVRVKHYFLVMVTMERSDRA